MRSCTLLLVVGVLAWSTVAFAEGDDAGAGAPVEATSATASPAETAPDDPPAAASADDPAPPAEAAPPSAGQEAEAGTPLAEIATESPTPDAAVAPPPGAAAPGADIGGETPDAISDEMSDEMPAEMAAGQAMGDGWEIAEETAEEPVEAPAEAGADPAAATSRTFAGTERGALGPEGIDEHGHHGRIHTVIPGDTLWDISNAYLGTPWVWPAVWEDNGEIENPHLILPGDHIWITAGEMRKVSRERAEEMIAADNEVEPAPAELADEDPLPTLEPEAEEADLMADDVPAAMDQLPVAVPLEPARAGDTGRSVRIAEREAMGFVSSESVDAATSVLDSSSPRTFLVEGDMIYLGLGEGRVEVGDEFTIFRDAEPVRDVDGGRLLGYHVDILGWAVVRKVEGESAIAEIRMSYSEAERGDLVMPRHVAPVVVPVKSTPEGVDGRIVFMPNARTTMGSGDYVYLNRGALHGFEVGSEVQVFVPGRLKKEPVSGEKVMTPDRVDAQMVLVEVKPDTSVAYVIHTQRELEIGDRVRAARSQVASR